MATAAERAVRLAGATGLLAGACFGIEGRAWAQPAPPVELVVTRTAGAAACPDQPALLERVNGQAPRMPLPTNGQPLILRVALAGDGERFTADIQVLGRKQGVRQLNAEGPGCELLAEALVVTLAMIIDEEAQATQPPPPGPAGPAPHPSEPARPATEPEPTETSGWGFLGMAGSYAFPAMGSAFAAAGAEARWGAWSLQLSGFATLPRRLHHQEGDVLVMLVGGELAVCAAAEPGLVVHRAGLCVRANAASLSGTGRGFNTPYPTRRRPWSAVGAGPSLRGPIVGWLEWGVDGAVLAPLWHDTFSGRNPEGDRVELYRTEIVAGWLGIRLLGRIW